MVVAALLGGFALLAASVSALRSQIVTLEHENAVLVERLDKISTFLWDLDERAEELDVQVGYAARRARGNTRELRRRFPRQRDGRLLLRGTKFQAFGGGFFSVPNLVCQSTNGFYVRHVYEDSRAHRGGLRRGDLITAVNGYDVSTANAVIPLAGRLGDTCQLELDVLRGRDVNPLRLDWECEDGGEAPGR